MLGQTIEGSQAGPEVVRLVPGPLLIVRNDDVVTGTQARVVLDHDDAGMPPAESMPHVIVHAVDVDAEQVELVRYFVLVKEGLYVVGLDTFDLDAFVGRRRAVHPEPIPAALQQEPRVADRAVADSELNEVAVPRADVLEDPGDNAILAVLAVDPVVMHRASSLLSKSRCLQRHRLGPTTLIKFSPVYRFRLFFVGNVLRFVLANSRNCFLVIDFAICREAPLSDDFERSPRFAARAAPAAICCFFDFAGIQKIRGPRTKWT